MTSIQKTYMVLVIAALCAAIAIVGGWLLERMPHTGPCMTGDHHIGNGMIIHGTWCGETEMDAIVESSAQRVATTQVPSSLEHKDHLHTMSPGSFVGCIVSAGIPILEPDIVEIYAIECEAFAPYSDLAPGIEIKIDSRMGRP